MYVLCIPFCSVQSRRIHSRNTRKVGEHFGSVVGSCKYVLITAHDCYLNGRWFHSVIMLWIQEINWFFLLKEVVRLSHTQTHTPGFWLWAAFVCFYSFHTFVPSGGGERERNSNEKRKMKWQWMCLYIAYDVPVPACKYNRCAHTYGCCRPRFKTTLSITRPIDRATEQSCDFIVNFIESIA